MRTLRCDIADIGEWYPRLFLDPHTAACVAVLRRYGGPPAVFAVECEHITSRWLGQDTRFLLEVSWTEEWVDKAERLLATMQAKPLVELASVALALILARRVANLQRLSVTEYGERADYRSQDGSWVLEISGTEILKELGRRHREKAAQAASNPFGWAAYVVVCAFSAGGHRIRFSAHLGEGEGDGEGQG